jgi:hypothetical protein
MARPSRRSLLRSLTGAGTSAALGAAVVAVTATRAGAVDGDNVRAGQDTTATNRTRVIKGVAAGPNVSGALAGDSRDDNGVVGTSFAGHGVFGVVGGRSFVPPLQAGVHGEAISAAGTAGTSRHGIGVAGRTVAGIAGVSGLNGAEAEGGEVAHAGVVGDSHDNYGVLGRSDNTGVVGTSSAGSGVWGISGEGVGVVATSNENTAMSATTLTGTGVRAETFFGPFGVDGSVDNNATGIGINGRCDGTSGIGVNGFSGENLGVQGYGAKAGVFGVSFAGLGGQFAGARAALRLFPRGGTGAPTTGQHEIGELVIDSGGSLFVCTANGSPGTWRRIRYV